MAYANKERKRANEARYRSERGATGTRIQTLRWKYGLKPAQYMALARQQGWGCALCRASFDDVEPYVDHDHETNRVRGLLCNQCNVALGAYERMKGLDVEEYLCRP